MALASLERERERERERMPDETDEIGAKVWSSNLQRLLHREVGEVGGGGRRTPIVTASKISSHAQHTDKEKCSTEGKLFSLSQSVSQPVSQSIIGRAIYVRPGSKTKREKDKKYEKTNTTATAILCAIVPSV